MAQSQNGWPAASKLKTRVIEPVKGVRLRVADNDDVATVLNYVASEFHKRVDDITKPHPADDWGFAYRANRNDPNSLSNHSSGTAMDLDSTEHPNGVPTERTFTNRQIAEIHKILDECEGVVRWGGDYRHTIDAMHFEINVPPNSSKLKAVAKKLRGSNTVKTIVQIAKEVIEGRWGNGEDRKNRLTAAGYKYSQIQAEVRHQLSI